MSKKMVIYHTTDDGEKVTLRSITVTSQFAGIGKSGGIIKSEFLALAQAITDMSRISIEIMDV